MASSTHQVGLLGQLEGVQECADHGPELVQNQAFQGLHDVGRQCRWSAVLLAAGMGSILGWEPGRMSSTPQGPSEDGDSVYSFSTLVVRNHFNI